MNFVPGFAGSAGLAPGCVSVTGESFTMSVVFTSVIDPSELAARAAIVSLPPRWGGSASVAGKRVEKRLEPSAGNDPIRKLSGTKKTARDVTSSSPSFPLIRAKSL